MHPILQFGAFAGLAYIIKNMATQEQLNAALDKVEAALTEEIKQIKAIPGVPDSAIERLDILASRISGIVADPMPEPPVEPPAA